MTIAGARRFAILLALGALVSIGSASTPVLGASPYFKDVCASGCTYSSVQAAIDSITDSDASRVYTVFIDSGILASDTSISTQGKDYINFVGRGLGVSVLQASALWFQNVADGLTSPYFFDMSGSTNVSLVNLSIDARTADPGGLGSTMLYSGVKVDPGPGEKVLIESCEIQGIKYALWDVSTATGGFVEVYNSKVRGAQYAVYAYAARWHIFSSDLRAVDNGGTSGTVSSPAGLYVYASDAVVWGSHLHVESSQPDKLYEVNGARVLVGTLTLIGSTTHVKMTTTSIGHPNRPMSAAFVYGGSANFIGTEFLYENAGGSLSQGRLTGLRIGFSGTTSIAGCTFRDAGGSGGTRSDLLSVGSTTNAMVHVAGTRVASIASQNGGSVPPGLAKAFDTLAEQKGVATFPGSGSMTVTLPVPLPDALYSVALSANTNETVWVTGKSASGFTLNSSNAASTASVDWVIMR